MSRTDFARASVLGNLVHLTCNSACDAQVVQTISVGCWLLVQLIKQCVSRETAVLQCISEAGSAFCIVTNLG